MRNIRNITLMLALGASGVAQANLVARFPMDVVNGRIEESVSGATFTVEGNFAPENVAAPGGKALRFDGYTSHVETALGDIIPAGSRQMTVSLMVALPCYPIIKLDTDTSEKTPIVTCLDKDKKTGFGFYVGFNGKYSFNTYIGGWPVNIEVDTPLPVYQWNSLTAVIDCDNRVAKLYNNGVEVGSSKVNGTFGLSACTLYLGQGASGNMYGPFELMSYNGLIDDISIWNEAKTEAEIAAWTSTETPDLDIPASRFADDMLRPRFHGMPAAGWTNECHGMWHADGRYHLFFQKNGDGPYMARLHWGHISSENLYDWREERIALAPGDTYDMKGCWSGCVFSDPIIIGSKPNILYTSVDYAKASVSLAMPEGDNLEVWNKAANNPIIGGRPAGLSDDFRDPYFFRNGDEAYIIVGSSKNGVGTTTLHRYTPAGGTWSNTGELFFTGGNVATDGTFWEMPNITPMPVGKWLFTATPIGTSQGVRTLYWTGSISDNGSFQPDANSSKPRLVEMNSRDGFGLLSPTIYRHADRTIVMGIVPDKLPSEINWKLGWAHCYSLPREWQLGDDGSLIQKPASELAGLRTSSSYSKSSFTLNGTEEFAGVDGRSAELCATFEVGSARFGFNIFKSGASEAVVYYNPASGEVIADFSGLARIVNDAGVYDGVYRCPLPVRPKAGESLKMNIFIDHSILDIFINDRYATSIRVFPTESDANTIEAFAEGDITVRELNAWTLDVNASGAGIDDVRVDTDNVGSVDVYNLQGVRLRSGVDFKLATDGLPAGLYIVGNRKVRVN